MPVKIVKEVEIVNNEPFRPSTKSLFGYKEDVSGCMDTIDDRLLINDDVETALGFNVGTPNLLKEKS